MWTRPADAKANNVATRVLQPLSPIFLAQPLQRGVKRLRCDERLVREGLAVAAEHLFRLRIDALDGAVILLLVAGQQAADSLPDAACAALLWKSAAPSGSMSLALAAWSSM